MKSDQRSSRGGSAAMLLLASRAVLALTVSGAIAALRVTEGELRPALFANALMTAAAIGAVIFLPQLEAKTGHVLSRGARVAFQLGGVALGIAVAHVALRAHVRHASELAWLSEKPAQFVNDVVAVLAAMGLARAFAPTSTRKALDLGAFVAVAALVAFYAWTHSAWHVDHAPHYFATVQQCVVAQFTSAALALLVFRFALARRDSIE